MQVLDKAFDIARKKNYKIVFPEKDDKRVFEAASYLSSEKLAQIVWLDEEPVTGFGHRVYRKKDPRAVFLKEGLKKLSIEKNEPKWFKILENVVLEMKPYSRHGLNVNVDFYSGAIYNLQKIPKDLYVPIFSIGRAPGWVAQCIEQFETNILIRPLTEYNGPKNRQFKEISER